MMPVDPVALAKVVEAVRQAVRAQTIKCLAHIVSEVYQQHCLCCNGTGLIFNPAYAPLLAMVEKQCEGCAGYLSRDLSTKPNGEVEGALRKAIRQIWDGIDRSILPTAASVKFDISTRRLLNDLDSLGAVAQDARQEALEDVLVWLTPTKQSTELWAAFEKAKGRGDHVLAEALALQAKRAEREEETP
ncbi:MAG: hypothetical protein Q8R28_11175 [Dehalococcoidia bacterium]|nr:hypothetical protein [Dehalococcoidia bacterium]